MTQRPPASVADEDGPERPSTYVRFRRQREPGPDPAGEEPTRNAVVVFGRTPLSGWPARASVPAEQSPLALRTVSAVCTVLGIAATASWMPRGLAAAGLPWPAVAALVALAIVAPVVVFVRANRRD